MLDFLRKKEKLKKDDFINEIYAKLKTYCHFDELDNDKKTFLRQTVTRYGYLPYPHIRALEELSAAETLYALEIKWQNNGVFKDGKFEFNNADISPLQRNNATNSDWIKKEGHDIKLINLAGLGNGNYSENPGKFFDWLKQILILPTGNLKRGIFDTTVYLIPFHPREFGCAYLPTSSEVSSHLNDELIEKDINLSAKEQVQLFVTLTQLAGHPVIYDVLPQSGRFAKIVLAKPEVARWFDIKDLMKQIKTQVELLAQEFSKTLNPEDVEVVKNIYIQTLDSGAGELSGDYLTLFNKFDNNLKEFKKHISNKMLEKKSQIKLQKRASEIISKIHGYKSSKKLKEQDITKQDITIQTLIKEGLWPSPGGAWCSSGVPVLDKMSECGGYPIFLHYDLNGKDVSVYANLDCQTPFYFTFLENGKRNLPVINFFAEYMNNIQEDYGFDGFRVDHVDHVVDEVSMKDGNPISYRASVEALKNLNSTMKEKLPYFISLAEYMLWDNYYKEYHDDMKFDILWGNDIVCQSDKTPQKIIEDNTTLANYNIDKYNKEMLSILKTYNNQDGEFSIIDRYPSQLGESGALFKWFKYKFLPGGKYANRPVMYIDGDESFTQKGIEDTIGNEISMKRGKNYEFYNQFDAINRLSKNLSVTTEGEARIIEQDDDGFVSWIITKECSKNAILVVANYKASSEKFTVIDEDDSLHTEIKYGKDVYNHTVYLPCDDYIAVAEYVYNGVDYEKVDFKAPELTLKFDKLYPSQFKIFELQR